MKIAVVGSGISGLSAAYYLSKKHHVDLFEKENHFGGHSHTIDLFFDEKKVSVDIGFIVFNLQTYPNLINFFKENDIKNAPQTYLELAANVWNHKYTREEAGFPNEYVRHNKYWAPVARVDNVYGDRNLVCSCPSMDEYQDEAA